ncbi:T-complex protein 1 subunit eta-like [Eurosta solidaginis]|uniref:T-complex protein 1 subunit eta-like n=1 Tax=Eurosta solidaginis TaxID=178769 RepID=UPI00353179DC
MGGTDSSQGKPQLISNINASQSIVDAVRTTLGPRSMDKHIVDSSSKATISNDGATIMKLLDIVHPAVKLLSTSPNLKMLRSAMAPLQ